MRKPFSNDKTIIELYGIVHAESPDAILVDFGNADCWLPKSLLEDWPDKGESGEILMPEWLALDKGLI